MRFLLACLFAAVVSAVQWTEKDELWLRGEVPASTPIALGALAEGGIEGRWDAYSLDYDGQDAFLAKLGVPWAARTAIYYSKPTFRFAKKELTSQQIDTDNNAKIPSAAGANIPVLEMKTEILYTTRVLDARMDGQEFHTFDERASYGWTVRTNTLPDGRVVLVKRNEKGVIRELRVALSKDPKGEQAGRVLFFEVQLEPTGETAQLGYTAWLNENKDLSVATQFLQ